MLRVGGAVLPTGRLSTTRASSGRGGDAATQSSLHFGGRMPLQSIQKGPGSFVIASLAALAIHCQPVEATVNEFAQVGMTGDDIRIMMSTQDVQRDQEDAIALYARTFLEKMLGELNGGDTKTVDHVSENLVAYLSKGRSLTGGLRDLRNSTPFGLADYYDSLRVDGGRLAGLLLDQIPQADGVEVVDGIEVPAHVLVGAPGADPAEQVDALFRAVWKATTPADLQK